MNRKTFQRVALFPLLLGASLSAMATGQPAVDVADVTAGIANQVAPIGLVAVAVMGIFVALKAYKWVRRALS